MQLKNHTPDQSTEEIFYTIINNKTQIQNTEKDAIKQR